MHMKSRLWRVVISVGMAGISMSLFVGAGTAAAHPNDPHETDEQHAAQDLAGTSIEQIEKDTRANALKIKKATGTAPGGRTADQQVANEGASSRAATDPGQGGQWSAVVNTPVVPVFQAVLPNGKVLMWDSVGDQPVDSYPNHTFTRATVWDPKTNTAKQVNVAGYNIFCAGYVQLADGRVLVAGGNRSSAQDGIVQTHLFDWRTETWARGPDMSAARWYPSVAALGNGEALIVGGGPATAEVHQVDRRLRRLTGFSSFDDRVYPFLVPRPDGRVELVGPYKRMETMSTAGVGALAATRDRDGIDRTYGSFATYDIGKVIVVGGGNVTEDGQSSVPTKTAAVVDVNGSGTTVRATGSMSVGRRQANLTILADGSVLATGGQSSANGLLDLQNPVFAAERWDPATGRVMTGGGGICGTCATKGYLEKNIEYFSPPYLFTKDGSGSPAPRPVIDSAPAATGYARTFAVSTEQAASIDKVGLVRLGAPTHAEDQGQRYVPLEFKTSGSALTVTAPANPNVAPPGYYMLFVTNTAGVPSVAKIVKLEATYQPVGTATRNDYNGDKNADIAVWRPSNGTWNLRGISTTAHGSSSDKPVQADYDGDNRTDLAVWRPSSGDWQIRGEAAVRWGVAGDVPAPADYTGDGRADLAVWRPSTGAWYLRGISTPTFGLSRDKPVPADYNGDGKADIAVWRPSNGTWYVRGISTTTFGLSTDKPVQADYDGDGKTDIAVWRPSNGTWYVRGKPAIRWGVSGDIPVPDDYNGDGKAELAVWRPSTGEWWIRGATKIAYGQKGDIPV
jgi:hypothetical protein